MAIMRLDRIRFANGHAADLEAERLCQDADFAQPAATHVELHRGDAQAPDELYFCQTVHRSPSLHLNQPTRLQRTVTACLASGQVGSGLMKTHQVADGQVAGIKHKLSIELTSCHRGKQVDDKLR